MMDLSLNSRKKPKELNAGESKFLGVMTSLVALYVAQAIPMYLIAAALPAIFRERGIDLIAIGSLSFLMAPWVFKFLWAPVVDRYGSVKYGKRKSWIVPLHISVCALIITLGFLQPEQDLALFFPILLLMSIAASTQDIATDAYSVEHLSEEMQGRGGAIQGGAVALGVLIGGSMTLFLHDIIGWRYAVWSAALLSLILLLPILFIPEYQGRRHREVSNQKPSLRHFFKRPEAWSLLGFVLLFRLSEGLVKSVEQAFLVDKGFSLSQIGAISGGAAALVGLVGACIAVYAMKLFPMIKCLKWIGILRTLCFLGFALMASHFIVSSWVLVALSAMMTFIRYLELSILYAVYMRFSCLSQAGTDFTFLASMALLMYMVGGFAAGYLAQSYGYFILFCLATFLSILTLWASLQLIKTRI